MPDIDNLIKDALDEQETAIMNSTKDLGYFALAIGLFSGKLGWVAWVIMLVQGLMFVAGVWTAWHFFNAEEVLEAQKWGASSIVLILMASQMKLSFMPQIQADRVLREIKRLELLVLHEARK